MTPGDLSHILAEKSLSDLYRIRETVDRLITDRESGDGVVEERRSGSRTYRLELVYCGKGCRGCPHGPYWYCYWKEGGRTRSRYIGKSLPEEAMTV